MPESGDDYIFDRHRSQPPLVGASHAIMLLVGAEGSRIDPRRRVEEPMGGALARRVEEPVGGTLAQRVAVREEPSVFRGPPVVGRVISEPAAEQEMYVAPGAEKPEYAGPAAVAF